MQNKILLPATTLLLIFMTQGYSSDQSNGNDLTWSENPGAHEVHLKRRLNNPYFPESRRIVTHEDLNQAKKKDDEDYLKCDVVLKEIGKEIESLRFGSTSGTLLRLRERIDDLIYTSLSVGGHATDIAKHADKLRNAVILGLQEAFTDDSDTLSRIDEANKHHKEKVMRFYNTPVIAHMIREDSPILKNETISTIISESPEGIATFINLLPSDTKPIVENGALILIKEALNAGFEDPLLAEKLAVFGIE
jgi:hypothetical protein